MCTVKSLFGRLPEGRNRNRRQRHTGDDSQEVDLLTQMSSCSAVAVYATDFCFAQRIRSISVLCICAVSGKKERSCPQKSAAINGFLRHFCLISFRRHICLLVRS